jgi:hypothetical protein
MTSLNWLPEIKDWRDRIRAIPAAPDDAWEAGVTLANTRIDFIRTNALDEAVRKVVGQAPPKGLGTKPVRLAILGSCTLAHLHGAIRVAGLRRGIHITIYEADFGQYWQELTDPDSGLFEFAPTAILFALDGHHLAAGVNASMQAPDAAAALEEMQNRIRE